MSMSISFKKATNKTNINHNNRKLTDKQKEKNPHIDYLREHENKYLVQDDIKQLYEREFSQALTDYNAKQKRADRKIDDYFQHIKNSKKTALQQEMVIQVGEQDDFVEGNEAQRLQASELLEEWFNEFEARNPNLKVYNAVIHNDEASPHMHLNFVPVAEGYKRGLERQVSFDRAIKQQDASLNQTRPFDDWREKEVALLENKLKERGIERKIVGTNEYKDVNEYKQKQDELKAINQTLEHKQKAYTKISEVVPDEDVEIPFLKKEKDLFRRETGNYVLNPEQYEKAAEQINASVHLKNDYDRMRTGEIVEQYNELTAFSQRTINLAKEKETENEKLKEENKRLKQHNQALEKKVTFLTATVKNLEQEIALTYHATRKFLKERTDDFKSLFKGYISNVKEYINGYEQTDIITHETSVFEEIAETDGLDRTRSMPRNKNKDMDMER